MNHDAHYGSDRVLARLVISVLTLVSLGLPGARAQDAGTSAAAPSHAVHGRSARARVSAELAGAAELVGTLMADSQGTGPSLDAAQRTDLRNRLKQRLSAIRAAEAGVRAEFDAIDSDLSSKTLPGAIHARHRATVSEFDRRAAEFRSLEQAWQASASDGSLADLANFFERHPVKGRGVPFDANRLSWGRPAATTREPVTTLNAESTVAVSETLAGASAVGPLAFEVPPEPDQSPTEADLAQTPETVPTPAILAKVAALGANPVAIHNWVRNSVEFVPTWGALQSADETLAKRRGNAHDIASLEIALLRAAHIPARYHYGTIEITAAQAQHWLGATSAPAAQQLLAQGGIATRGIVAGGSLAALQLEHVWVQAYVNWAPSRGARQGSASQHVNPIGSHNAWVALDASFKALDVTDGAPLDSVLGLNPRGMVDSATVAAICLPDAGTRIDGSALQGAFEQSRLKLDAYAGQQGVDTSIAQLLGAVTLITQAPPQLAGGLPYTLVGEPSTVAAVADNQLWRLRWSLFANDTAAADGQAVVSLERPWHEVAGKRLSLSFAPATADDADLIASYLPAAPTDGSPVPPSAWPTSLPGYLVHMKAELRLEGELIASGGEFILGSELPMAIAVYNPDQEQWVETSPRVFAGETHAMVLDAHDIGAAELTSAKARWAAIQTALATPASAQTLSREQVAGEALRQLALGYLATADANARLFQRAADMMQVRLPSLARALTPAAVQTAYGIVTQVSFPGVALDVGRLQGAVVARAGGGDAGAYARQDMMRNAAYGHLVLERLLANDGAITPAASAIKVLASAATQTNPVYQIDAQNALALLPLVQTNATTRQALQDAAQTGRTLRVPQQPVVLGGWQGHAAAIEDEGGAGLYVLLDGDRHHLAVQYQVGGLGWLAVASPEAHPLALSWLSATVPGLHDAASDVLTPGSDGSRWQGAPIRSEVANGLFLAALAGAAGPTPCEALVPLVAAGLNADAGLGADGSALALPPVFESLPLTTARAGQRYQYAPTLSDPQALPIGLALVSAPSGMVLDSDRVLRWDTPALGSYTVVLRADNGRAVADQRFELTVDTAAQALELGLAVSPTVVDPGASVGIVVVSNGGSGSVSIQAAVNGQILALDAQGRATVTAGPAGTYRIVARATDAAETLERQAVFSVRDGADTVAPQALISTPAADAEVTTLIDVIGTASDANLAYYQLLLRPAGAVTSAWQELARGSTNVANATLGRLDPSGLANGGYELALRVVDINGQQTTAVVPIEIARDLKLGQFRLSFSDIRADLQGLPLQLTRTYDSTRRSQSGDFGWGWSAAANDVSIRKNRVLGLGWNVVAEGFNLCLRPAGQRRITVTLPDGGLYRFKARNLNECTFGQVPPLQVVFDPLPLAVGGGAGSSAGVAQLEVIVTDLVQAQGGILVNMDSGEPWNPSDFKLTTPEGAVYYLREGVGILRITDPYGNTVDYGPNGYQHSAGTGLALTRDTSGRITRATDPAGRSLSYAYNAQGELESVTDRTGQTTRFAYGRSQRLTDTGSVIEPHLLTAITDPDGNVIASQAFDDYGRLIASRDAAGQQSTVEFDTASNQQRVTDRRGNTTTYSFDAAGNVTKIVDAKGGITELTYDANGNELTRTDPLGHILTKTYDAATGKVLTERDALNRTINTTYVTGAYIHERLNPLSTTDAKGNTTSYGYVDDKQPGAVPTAITEPLGRTTAIGVDTKGNLRTLNVAGIATTYAYDAKGQRISETDGTGAVTTYTYDANGNELTRSLTRTVNGTPRTETTSSVYDVENRLIQQTDPTGAITRTTYNSAGKPITQTDALGRVTKYSYDANARPTRTEYPDGTAEATEYDANGNEVARSDRQGRTTRRVYDELDRLVQTTHPDGSAETTEYDAAGRVIATTDANGNRSQSEYDAAGQQTASSDASGRRTEYRYDLNGNRTETQTPDGGITRRTYDALNRVTQTLYPDGSTHSVTYRADGRKQSETDPRGMVSTYGYDAKGQLTSVTQSGVTQATTYAYDQTGAKTTQIDALGRAVRWVYDRAGRPLSRTLPDGAQETFQYDGEGNLSTHTDFGGHSTQYTYDTQGRPLTRITLATVAAPARTTTWTYNADGQRATQIESGDATAQGATTYHYDARGRLIALQTPQGDLAWTYDPAGRITERSTAEGTTGYSYDGDGRLQVLTAPDGKTTSYVYDAAGRNTRSEQQLAGSDKLVTERRYDSSDRQVTIAHSKQSASATTLVAGQTIARGQGGAVTRIDSFDATASFDATTGAFSGNPSRVQLFGYDANQRLTSESEYKGTQLSAFLADANAPATQATTYAYDAVGNRTSKTVATPAGTESTSYSYDANDRLTGETLTTTTGSTVTTTYTWDGNGNLASKTTPSEYTAYVFDADNRLIEVKRGASISTANTVANFGYDADGQRVRKETASGITQYLIDPSTTWPQVVLETKGSQRTAYTWGDQLRGQSKGAAGSANSAPTEALIPLQGHLGTTIAAVDASGNVVERYDSGAFGEPTNANPRANHQYTGEYWDAEARLTYLRARWYEPTTGRMPSIDPAMGRIVDARSLNRYAYAQSDAANGRDPSGMFTMAETSIAGDIQSMLGNLQADFGFNLISSALDRESASDSSTGWAVVAAMVPFSGKLITRGLQQINRGAGWVRYSKKFPPSASEIVAAEQVAEKTGGRIHLRGTGVQGADALLNGTKYEIKSITGARGVSTNIKSSMRRQQADRFIIDGRGADLTEEHVLREMGSLDRDGYVPTEVIVILRDGAI